METEINWTTGTLIKEHDAPREAICQKLIGDISMNGSRMKGYRQTENRGIQEQGNSYDLKENYKADFIVEN